MTQRIQKVQQDIEASGLVEEPDKEDPEIEEKDSAEVKIVSPQNFLYFYQFTDLSLPSNLILLAVVRLAMCVFCSKTFVYPDEYWQATEVAYNMVFGGVNLTWEWQSDSRIRSILYPFFLSLPLRLLKVLHLDLYWVVRASYYVAQGVLVIVGDVYFYKIGQKLLGEQAARVTLYIYLTNCFYNMHIIRCFGNSVEAIFFIVLFYYYLHISKEFDRNMVVFTILMCFSLMIRCTSPLGWVPLILYKLIMERSLCAFIKSAFLVALPTLMVLTALDSLYYGQLTFVPFTFLYKNLIDNVSASFGISSRMYYFWVSIPNAFNFTLAVLLMGLYNNVYENLVKRQFPFLMVLSSFYMLFLSMVPHKENRFIMPVIPFLMLMAGDFLSKRLKTLGFIIKIYILFIVIWESVLFGAHSFYHAQSHAPFEMIMEQDSYPHSVFHSYRLYAPGHSWLHVSEPSHQTQLLYSHRLKGTVGQWGGTAFDQTNPSQTQFSCAELLGGIIEQELRPKYAVFQEKECRLNNYCNEICYKGLENNGYEKIFEKKALQGWLMKHLKIYQNDLYVFKLKDGLEPIT